MPLECWRGELADVLAVFDGSMIDSDEPFSMAFRAVVLWAEETTDPATCELVEFAPMLGVLADWDMIEAVTFDGITILTTPDGVRVWLRLLKRE